MQGSLEFNRGPFFVPLPSQARRKGAGTRTWLIISVSVNPRIEELGKNPIMRRIGVSAHDLRVLGPEVSYPSKILCRERAIVVNLEHIKAIITATEILVPNPKDPTLASFVRDLECKLSHSGRIDKMEGDNAIGESPSNMLPEASNSSPRTSTLEMEAYPALDDLSTKTSSPNLKRVRLIKHRLVALFGRVQKVRDEIEHLLDDDMAMAEMYLTDKLATLQSEGFLPQVDCEDDANAHELDDDRDEEINKNNTSTDGGHKPNIEELEMLLGAYFVQIEGILEKLSTIQEYVHDTEDYINIILDDKQNQLLQMGVVIYTATMMLDIGNVICSIMGMNIGIPLFNSVMYLQWYEASAGIAGCCLFLYVIAILWGKKKKLLG